MDIIKVTLYYFLQIIFYLIFGRAMLSWFVRDGRNPIMSLLVSLTEPLLHPIRELLFKFKIGGNMVDFSPLVAILIIQLLMQFVIML